MPRNIRGLSAFQAFALFGPRVRNPIPKNSRKCILSSCDKEYEGNQLACCKEHLIEWRRQEKERRKI